jgi:small subunit ribosomal protein S17
MFRRKKKEEEAVEPVPATEAASESAPPATEAAISQASGPEAPAAESESVDTAPGSEAVEARTAGKRSTSGRGNRVQKIGIVTSDKMQKTVLVRVDRTVLHQKYRRYVKRRSKFMAHDDLGSTTGDRVRIVETRPLSARKRWRVVEIVQKAAK